MATRRGACMKVAFTSSNGIKVDQNFRGAAGYTVWDIGPCEAYYVCTITIDADCNSNEDTIAIRADLLHECAIVCSREISGPAAAKLAARGIHPLKTGADTPVEDIIARLQTALCGTVSPWLRKELLKTPWLLADRHIWS